MRDEQGNIVIREWPQNPGIDYVEAEVLIHTQRGALVLPKDHEEARIEECEIAPELLEVLLECGARYVRKVFPGSIEDDTVRVLNDSTTANVPDLSRIYQIELEEGSDVYYAIGLLCDCDKVIWAEPNGIPRPLAVPNDEYYDSQWNLKAEGFGIDCERAWDYNQSGGKVKVAVIGSGITPSHPDLAAKIIGGRNYHDLCSPDDWQDDGHNNGHETKVASIIDSITNNEIGMAGVAGGWDSGGRNLGASIVSVRITDYTGNTNTVYWVRAICGAIDDFESDILNLCWGTRYYSDALHLAIAYVQFQGEKLVAAMGNEGYSQNIPIYPAGFENNWLIAVGAYGSDGNPCGGSSYPRCECGIEGFEQNHGHWLDIVCPGENIPVILENQDIDPGFCGTSAATPHATGVISMIQHICPTLWSEDIDAVIKLTAIDGGTPGWDNDFGSGRLNAGQTIETLFNSHYYSGEVSNYIEIPSISQYISRNRLYTGRTTFYGPGEPVGNVLAECWRVVYRIQFPDRYESLLGVWGKRFCYDQGGNLRETGGWSASNKNVKGGFCEVVPGSIGPESFQIATYTFFAYYNNQWQWFPFNPDYPCPRFCYAIWGIKKEGQPNSPGKLTGLEPMTETMHLRVEPNPTFEGARIYIYIQTLRPI